QRAARGAVGTGLRRRQRAERGDHRFRPARGVDRGRGHIAERERPAVGTARTHGRERSRYAPRAGEGGGSEIAARSPSHPGDVLQSVFARDGPLAKAVSGFRTRPFQVEMAEAVSDAIAGNTVLVAEAGTGTGKTYAYLVPALLSGGKVIVSTGTKNLQDQLFDRDIPTV